MIHGGSVVAEGSIRDVRGEITSHPIQVLVRCDRPHTVRRAGVRARPRGRGADRRRAQGLLVRTRDAADFFTQLNRIVLDTGVEVETVAPADESVHAVYDYLIGDGSGGGSA